MKLLLATVAIVAAVILTTASAFAESLPPERPVDDLKVITTSWTGKLTTQRGEVTYNLTIQGDGTWQAVSPNGSSNGTVKVTAGQAKFESQTTGRKGTYKLYEGDGKRVLQIVDDDGKKVIATLQPK